jgi:hypothetical protein
VIRRLTTCRPLHSDGATLLRRCRVGGGAPQRWPPSAAQTGRTVFPYPAFTKVRLASRLDGRNLEWTFLSPVGFNESDSLLGRSLPGLSLRELIRVIVLAHLPLSLSPTTFASRLPQPTRLPIARSRSFHRVSGTIRLSDDSPGVTSHFAVAYRVAYLDATREPNEPTWGHVQIFRTVPSANTLVR